METDYSYQLYASTASYCNAIIDILTDKGFESLSVLMSDDKQSLTVLGYFRNVDFSLYFKCHSDTFDNPYVQINIINLIKYLGTSCYGKDRIKYVFTYIMDELTFRDVNISNEDNIVSIIASKNNLKYSFTFICPFWLDNHLQTKNHTKTNAASFERMNGHSFEAFCAILLRKNNYKNVEVTQGSGDQGIDIIAYKDDFKFGIQCKYYSSKIGNKSVQEVFAGKAFYRCDVGIVLTNSYFTKSAKELATATGIVLWDKDKLSELIKNSLL